MRNFIKQTKYLLEAFFAYTLYGFFYALPLDTASAVGGWLLEKIGPRLRVSDVARKNIEMALPETDQARREEIVRDMWNHLGRMAAELPHWRNMSKEEMSKRVEFQFEEGKRRNSGLCVSAHFGNYELAATSSMLFDVDVELAYRPANNPYVDKLINSGRQKCGSSLHKKGVGGVKSMLKTLQRGGLVAMLADQRTNTGIDVPFFGVMAKTTPAPANFALRYDVPVFMSRFQRTKGANYINITSKPLKIKKGATTEEVMLMINQEFERWIRQEPEQWFWVHKRWGKFWNK